MALMRFNNATKVELKYYVLKLIDLGFKQIAYIICLYIFLALRFLLMLFFLCNPFN